MMLSCWRKQQGYLYMDAIITMCILTVALTAITGLFLHSAKVSSSANHYTAATNIARQQMELLKKWPAAHWSDPELPNSIPWQGNLSQLTVNKTPFEVKTIINHPNDIDPTLIQVTVIVSWKELSGTKDVQLTTYFSKV